MAGKPQAGIGDVESDEFETPDSQRYYMAAIAAAQIKDLADTALTEFLDAAICQVIAGGVPDTLMPAWGSRLNDQELQSLVAFLRSWEEDPPAILPPVQEN